MCHADIVPGSWWFIRPDNKVFLYSVCWKNSFESFDAVEKEESWGQSLWSALLLTVHIPTFWRRRIQHISKWAIDRKSCSLYIHHIRILPAYGLRTIFAWFIMVLLYSSLNLRLVLMGSVLTYEYNPLENDELKPNKCAMTCWPYRYPLSTA